MKKLTVVIGLLLGLNTFALPRNYRVDTGINNLGQEWTTRALSEMVRPTVLLIDNNSNREIEVNCSKEGANPPPKSELFSFWVRSSTSMGIDWPKIKGDCWVRAVNGSATSGVIIITAIADN